MICNNGKASFLQFVQRPRSYTRVLIGERIFHDFHTLGIIGDTCQYTEEGITLRENIHQRKMKLLKLHTFRQTGKNERSKSGKKMSVKKYIPGTEDYPIRSFDCFNLSTRSNIEVGLVAFIFFFFSGLLVQENELQGHLDFPVTCWWSSRLTTIVDATPTECIHVAGISGKKLHFLLKMFGMLATLRPKEASSDSKQY